MEKSLEACFINDVLNLRRQYSHMPFNIWSLPQLLRFCETKLANHQDVHKIIIPKYSIQKKKKTKKNPYLTKIFPCPKICSNQNPMPNQKKKKFSHVQKFLFQPKSHVQQKFSTSKKKFSNVQPKFVHVWQFFLMSNTKNPYHHKKNFPCTCP